MTVLLHSRQVAHFYPGSQETCNKGIAHFLRLPSCNIEQFHVRTNYLNSQKLPLIKLNRRRLFIAEIIGSIQSTHLEPQRHILIVDHGFVSNTTILTTLKPKNQL